MFTIDAESELPKMLEQLKGILPDQWPKILAYAANETAFAVLAKYKAVMPSIFEYPTPFTLNSMYVQKAKPQAGELDASVQWRDFAGKGTSAGKYLKPDVDGGLRRSKGFESALMRAGLMPRGYYAVPSSSVQKDSYGNVAPSLFNAILAYLQANNDATQNRRVNSYTKMSTTKFLKQFGKAAMNADRNDKRARAAQKKRAKYFTVQPGDKSALAPGIYERITYGVITQLFFFVRESQYKAIFPFADIGAQKAADKFPEKLTEAIAASLLDRLQKA